MDAGAFEQPPIGGIAGEDRRRQPPHRRQRALVAIDGVDPRALALQCSRRRLPTLPAPMISTGGGVRALRGISAFERGNLGLGAGEHDDAVGLDDRVRKGRPQLAPLPHADDADAGALAQPGVAHRLSGEGRVARRQLRDLQAAVGADHVRVVAAGVGAVGEVLAELVLQRQHVRRTAELQDVDRVLLFDDRRDRQRRARSRAR